MNRPTKYKIIHGYVLENLIEQVNKAIKVGWIPQGGICIYNDKMYQAMCAYNVLGPYITRIAEDGSRVQISEGSNNES